MSTEDELGFIVDEDQSEQELPTAEGWQDQYNKYLFKSWKQGFQARAEYPDMTSGSNPYIGREGLVPMTCALGWEDGFVAAERGDSEDDCPYPEA